MYYKNGSVLHAVALEKHHMFLQFQHFGQGLFFIARITEMEANTVGLGPKYNA